MNVNFKLLFVFVSGVAYSFAVSYLLLLATFDKTGSDRHHNIGFHELYNMEVMRHEDESRWEAAVRGVRVACWVLTYEEYDSNATIMAVRQTWGKYCDKLVFISSSENLGVGVVHVDVPEGEEDQWGVTKAGLRYLYKNHLNDAEWFLNADENTYVIMGNLRSMLFGRNSSDLLYLGYRHKPVFKHEYIKNGSGYVLSRAALKRVVEKGLDNPLLCKPSHFRPRDDVLIGRCLRNLGITPGDTRDSFGRDRFFPVGLQDFASPDSRSSWHAYFKSMSGLKCCSDSAISFHARLANCHLYTYDYLINTLRVSKLGVSAANLPESKSKVNNRVEESSHLSTVSTEVLEETTSSAEHPEAPATSARSSANSELKSQSPAE